MEARWDTHPRWHEEGYWMEGTGMTRVCMHVGREGGNEGG